MALQEDFSIHKIFRVEALWLFGMGRRLNGVFFLPTNKVIFFPPFSTWLHREDASLLRSVSATSEPTTLAYKEEFLPLQLIT